MISAALKIWRKILAKLRRRSASTSTREVERELTPDAAWTAAWSRQPEELSSYFVELPTEIHLQILAFVSLEDVIALRQTCKTMASITRMHAVWIMVIQSLGLYAAEIFYNSYDLMSMPCEEVERLALRAFCFSKALLNPKIPILARKHTELLLPSMSVSKPSQKFLPGASQKAANSLPTRFDNCLLVSGGRYLFTSARPQSLLFDEWGSDYIHLWDLNASAESSTRTDPIASAHFQDYGIQLHAAFPTTCGTGLRLLVYARRNEETLNPADAGRYHVYEVFPRDEQPGFRLVAELRIERTWNIFYGHFPNEVIFHVENQLVVWNLESGDSFETNVGEVYPAILATDNHVALVSASDVVIWSFIQNDDTSLTRKALAFQQRLPIPFATTSRLLVAASPSGLSVSLPQDPDATPLISIQYVSSEASGSSDYILNDVFELRSTTTSGGTCHFYLRRCHPTSVKLTLKGNLYWMLNARTGIQTSGCYFQSAVMATAREKDHIRVLVTPVPGRIGSSRKKNAPFTQHVRLLRLEKGAVLGHWLCPISGRLVLLLNARRRRLFVIDFCPRMCTGAGDWSTALTFSHSKVDICV